MQVYVPPRLSIYLGRRIVFSQLDILDKAFLIARNVDFYHFNPNISLRDTW